MLTGYVVSDDNIVRPVGKETSSYPFATHLEQNEVHGAMVEFGGLAKISDWDPYFAIVMVYESPSQK
jgi:hypothetical protein